MGLDQVYTLKKIRYKKHTPMEIAPLSKETEEIKLP